MDKVELFPKHILTDTTKSREAVFVAPDQAIYVDSSLAAAFAEADADYAKDPAQRIRHLRDSVGKIGVRGTFIGVKIGVPTAYLTTDMDGDSTELMLATSPLNDGVPKSSAERMIKYIYTPEPSFLDIALAKPNTWGPITKLDGGYQVMARSGKPMPTAQLLSRVPPMAFTLEERAALAQGDYRCFGRIALAFVKDINVSRALDGKALIDTVHFFGAGIAQRAIGAAAYFESEQDTFKVGSVHAMNLSLRRGVSSVKDHVSQRGVNEPSRIDIPDHFVRIDEPKIRQDIDHRGTDTLQMLSRQAWAIKDLAATTLPFMMAYRQTVGDVELLLDRGVPVRLTTGMNVAMAQNTVHLLPVNHKNMHLSTIVGLEGQRVTMMSNEHAGVVAVAMALGPRDYETQQSNKSK